MLSDHRQAPGLVDGQGASPASASEASSDDSNILSASKTNLKKFRKRRLLESSDDASEADAGDAPVAKSYKLGLQGEGQRREDEKEDNISEYERMRLKRIAQNKLLLMSTGILRDLTEGTKDMSSSRTARAVKKEGNAREKGIADREAGRPKGDCSTRSNEKSLRTDQEHLLRRCGECKASLRSSEFSTEEWHKGSDLGTCTACSDIDPSLQRRESKRKTAGKINRYRASYSDPSRHEFKVGVKVMARYKNHNFYDAVLRKDLGDGTWKVRWEDGDSHDTIKNVIDIRPMQDESWKHISSEDEMPGACNIAQRERQADKGSSRVVSSRTDRTGEQEHSADRETVIIRGSSVSLVYLRQLVQKRGGWAMCNAERKWGEVVSCMR